MCADVHSSQVVNYEEHSHFGHTAQCRQVFRVSRCVNTGQLGRLFVNRPGDQSVEFFVETKVDSGANVVQSSLSAGHIDFTESDFRKVNVFEIQNLQAFRLGGCLCRAID